MSRTTIQFEWQARNSTAGYRTGVALHGHTMHSRECLSFLPRYLHQVPGISQVVSYYERGPRPVEFGRAWWTPPLSPASALRLERKQIAGLGLRAMVSITDHDDIEAGLALGITETPRDTPLSVEWTVPYERTILHLGVHNIPRDVAQDWMTAMNGYTATPSETKLPGILDEMARIPDVLVVLNHPFWLEEGVTEEDHRAGLNRFLQECLGWVDAFELNGSRKWPENAKTVELARCLGRPLVSGGDRHACEPAACINLTNSKTFSDFACEVHAGQSSILFLSQYRDPMAQRILEAGRDILATYPEYPGRERWIDRIFYRGRDGVARTLGQVWNGKEPRWLGAAVAAVQFGAANHFRQALRLLISRGEMQS